MRAAVLAGVLALAATSAAGHPMPNSTVVVQAGPGVVELTVSAPQSELAAALGGPPGVEAATRYLAGHAGVTGDDGRPWIAGVGDVREGEDAGHASMEATLTFRPETGASPRAARLRYDAVIDRVASHYVLVYRKVGEAQTPLGRLQAPVTELALP